MLSTRIVTFELNPARDLSGATARVATWIVTHFLSEIFDRQSRAGELEQRG